MMMMMMMMMMMITIIMLVIDKIHPRVWKSPINVIYSDFHKIPVINKKQRRWNGEDLLFQAWPQQPSKPMPSVSSRVAVEINHQCDTFVLSRLCLGLV